MSIERFDRLRISLTVLVSIAIWSLLAWQYFNDGVPAHHVLDNPDLPLVSDWFGAAVLPVLTWFLLGWTRRRMQANDSPALQPVIVGLVCGVAWGVAMLVSYFSDYQWITDYLFFGLLPLALLLPVYRPECLLGFVLGMSVGFGAVLPTVFGSLMALATFVIHRFVGLPLQRLLGLQRGAGVRDAS